MLYSFSLFRRAALATVAALSLAACNRAEYAVLPKSPAYLGSAPARVATRPTAPAIAAAPAVAVVPAPAEAPATLEPQVAPAKLTFKAPKTVAVAVPQSELAAPVAVAPAALQAPAVAAAPAAPARLNLVQRLMLKKVSKQLDKLMAKSPQLKQRSAAAGTARLDSGLRSALIVLLIGVILAAFSGVAGIFGILGAILIIVGLVLLLIYLLDQA